MILLARMPKFMLQFLCRSKNPETWVYYGKDPLVLDRLKQSLPENYQHSDYARELYAISESERKNFISWIDGITKENRGNREWFFSVCSVKNTYSSNLFLNICYFLVQKKKEEKGEKCNIIFVDSAALGKVFNKVSETLKGKYHFANILLEFSLGIVDLLKILAKYIRFCFVSLRRFFLARMVFGCRAQGQFKDKKDVTLIRNYVTGNFANTDDDIFEKHFFPGLGSHLKEKGQNPMYLSIPVEVKSYRELFKKVKLSRNMIIIADEILSFIDYLYAFCAPLWILFQRLAVIDYNHVDLQKLVKEEYVFHCTEDSFLSANLLCHLGKRLKQKGLKLTTLINWSEFQAFEKGLLVGMREGFPNANIVGSQPFTVPPNHLSLFLSEQDRLHNIVPDTLLLLGQGSRDYHIEGMKDLTVAYTPAFRYSYLFEEPNLEKKGNDLLVLLGYGFSNAVRTLRMIKGLNASLDGFDNILVKFHPASGITREKVERKLGVTFSEKFRFIDGNLSDYLDQVSVGICGATGTSVELVIRGIPVVLVGEKMSLTMNYLSFMEDRDMWRLCFNEREIAESIEDFQRSVVEKRGVLLQKAIKFREHFFTEQTESLWENYFNVNKREIEHA